MKHEPSPLSSQRYYYIKWKSHSFRLIIALAIMTNCVVWAFVASLCSHPATAIWLCVGAVFSTFMAVVEYRACDLYHTRYIRALCSGSLIDTNPTNQ